jgi:hypothetical protein
MRIDERVPRAEEHAVAVVVRERDGVLVDDADEAGVATLYEHCGCPSASAVATKTMSQPSMKVRSSSSIQSRTRRSSIRSARRRVSKRSW